nr:nitrile-specifier protein 5 [Quercus suber]
MLIRPDHGQETTSQLLTTSKLTWSNTLLVGASNRLVFSKAVAMAKLSVKWSLLASSDRPGRSSQLFSVLHSQAWVFGGEQTPRAPTDNRLDMVNLKARQGHATAVCFDASEGAPTPRIGGDSAAQKGALYLFSVQGGMDMAPIEEKGALWHHTPSKSLWEFIEPADSSVPYPEARSSHSMVSDGGINIYVHAGCPESGRLSDLWQFDSESRAWTGEQGGAIDVLDLAVLTWSTINFAADGIHGPEPRSVSALLALRIREKDLLVTLLGEREPSPLGHAGAGKMLADLWAFDLQRHQWMEIESSDNTPLPMSWFGADVMVDDSGEHAAIIHGGLAEDNSRLGDVWKLQLH